MATYSDKYPRFNPPDDLTGREHMMERLERFIDTSSVMAVLELMAEICREKAEHIRSNWQDEPMAKGWDRAASKLDQTAASKPICVVG